MNILCKVIFLAAFLAYVVLGSTTDQPTLNNAQKFRTMTFNIWESGKHVEDGIAKIAKHIKFVNPDVVALQEVKNSAKFYEILQLLGSSWHGYYRKNYSYPDAGIITRHPIMVDKYFGTDSAMGMKIFVQSTTGGFGRNFTVVSAHTYWDNFGPYATCNKLVTYPFQIAAGEIERVKNIRNLIATSEFKEAMNRSEQEPVFVMGDFNSPSHLDYTKATAKTHCGWVYAWPQTKILTDLGLKDVFRQIYTDPAQNPGNTWSTVNKYSDGWGYTIPEPQDRIDMIFYAGGKINPLSAEVYHGFKHIALKPNYQKNDWPSDHSSVFADFVLEE